MLLRQGVSSACENISTSESTHGPSSAPQKRSQYLQMLHAETLGITHPVTGELLSFTAPLPDDMAKALEEMEEVGTRRYGGSEEAGPIGPS